MLCGRALLFGVTLMALCLQNTLGSKIRRRKSKTSTEPRPQLGLPPLEKVSPLALELTSILEDSLQIMSPIARCILKAVQEGHSHAAELRVLMEESPIARGQSVDRYVDLSFDNLASSDWPAAERLINDYVVPRFSILRLVEFRLSQRSFFQVALAITMLSRVQARKIATEKGQTALRGKTEKATLSVRWDAVKFATGLDVGDVKEEERASQVFFAVMEQLVHILSRQFPDIKKCQEFIKHIGAKELWSYSKGLFMLSFDALYCIRNFLIFTREVYYSLVASTRRVSQKFDEIPTLLSKFMESVEESVQGGPAGSVELGPAALALLSRSASSANLHSPSFFSLSFANGIREGNGEYLKLHEIIEAAPIQPWEEVNSYLQFVISQYQLVDELGATRFVEEKVIKRSPVLRNAGFRSGVFENYVLYLIKSCNLFSPKVFSSNSPDSQFWELAKISVPTCGSDELGDINFVSERLVERLFEFRSFFPEKIPELEMCMHFLAEVEPKVLWDTFNKSGSFMCHMGELYAFTEAVYKKVKETHPESTQKLIYKVTGSTGKAMEDFCDFFRDHMSRYTWEWP